MTHSFHHDFLPRKELIREDRTTGRIYIDPKTEKEYRSVTSVLSNINKKSLEEWRARVGEEEANRISQIALKRGTAVHEIAEKFLLNDPVHRKGSMPVHAATFRPLEPILQEHVGTIFGIEHRLCSDVLRAAGTADLIAEWKGENAIIDFKTSKRLKQPWQIDNYFIQATAYSHMVNEMYGLEVPKMVILIMVDNGFPPQVFERDTKPFMDLTRKVFK